MRVSHQTLETRWAFHVYANPEGGNTGSEAVPLADYVHACSIVQQVQTEHTLTGLAASFDALFGKKGKRIKP